jgi:phage terminase large subunit-like protein
MEAAATSSASTPAPAVGLRKRLRGRRVDGRGYVLADRSCKLPPGGWARQAIDAYHEFQADHLVAERKLAHDQDGAALQRIR